MKYSTKQVIKMFLDIELSRLRESNEDTISPILIAFFSKPELIKMIRWLHKRGMVSKEHLTKLDKLNSHSLKELLAIVQKQSSILAYYIYTWRFENNYLYQKKGINMVFSGLGIPNHELNYRELKTWSRNDYALYQKLLVKAGYLIKAYGIYDKSVAPESTGMVTSQPYRFFDSYEEAENEIKELAARNKIQANDLQILHILVHA